MITPSPPAPPARPVTPAKLAFTLYDPLPPLPRLPAYPFDWEIRRSVVLLPPESAAPPDARKLPAPAPLVPKAEVPLLKEPAPPPVCPSDVNEDTALLIVGAPPPRPPNTLVAVETADVGPPWPPGHEINVAPKTVAAPALPGPETGPAAPPAPTVTGCEVLMVAAVNTART